MRINKLHLQDFGKFHDKDIVLTPGLNIIYGPNEAGKTTTKDFIVDMLYGIDKQAGAAPRFDHYEKRRPINGDSYSGSMEITTEDGQYVIERNFDKNEQKTTLHNLDTGLEVPLKKENELLGEIIDTDKSTYMNTLCIGQMEAATDKDINDKLNNYIVNMASAKAGDIDAVSAIVELKNKRSQFIDSSAEKRIAELSEKLNLERDYDAELEAVREEYRKVEEELNNPEANKLQFTPIKNAAVEEAEEKQRKLKEEEAKKDEKAPKTKREKDLTMLRNMGPQSILDNVFVILLIAIIVIALFVGIAYVVPVNVPQVKMVIMLFGVVLSLLMTIQVFVRRNALYKLLDEIEIEKNFEEAKNDSTAADISKRTEIASKLSDIRSKQETLLKERGEQEQYMKEIEELKGKLNTNDVEVKALDLAIKTIQDLSEEIYDSFGSVLNAQVSEIVARITENRYTEVRIDDQLKVMVKSGASFISMEYLSTSTIEQIYFALRLSIAKILIKEELPIVIDDIFVTYDEQRLHDTLSCISEYANNQVIIFTTNKMVKEIFDNLGVANHSITI